MARRIKVNLGKQSVRGKGKWPSEAAYVADARASGKRVTDALLKICKGMEDVSNEVMIEALEPTFEKAKMYTPKKTLALVDSGYLQEATFRGKARVEIGFAYRGKPAYAIYVHEIVEYNHQAPTRAKFLESAVYEDLGEILQRLAAGYRSRIFD